MQPASEVFNQRFLNEVPPKKLDDIVSQLEAQYGNLTGANVVGLAGPNTANVTLQFERAHAAAIIVLDPVLPRRVSGFRITSVGSASTVRKPGTARNPGSLWWRANRYFCKRAAPLCSSIKFAS